MGQLLLLLRVPVEYSFKPNWAGRDLARTWPVYHIYTENIKLSQKNILCLAVFYLWLFLCGFWYVGNCNVLTQRIKTTLHLC